MKHLKETIQDAATIEELLSVLEQLFEMFEKTGTTGTACAETLQLLARHLTDIQLAMNEMLYREPPDGERIARTLPGCGRHPGYLELYSRIEALHAAIDSSLRRGITSGSGHKG